MKRNLSTTGLSLSQAQSISNLCNQRCIDIDGLLSGVNNYEKTLEYNGKTLTEIVGKKISTDVKSLLLQKANLHGTQAFLLENIKLKTKLLNDEKNKPFVFNLERPENPKFKNPEILQDITEQDGWNQLNDKEWAEYLDVESHSAHIGKYIHKGGILNNLREELNNGIKLLEWREINKDSKIPVNVKVHHTSEDLLKLYEDLSSEHRKYEQRVNYFKAKVKNIVTSKNAEIAKENALAQEKVSKENEAIRKEYDEKLRIYNENYNKEFQEFQSQKHLNIKKIAALRIDVDPRFQEVVDKFLVKSED
jgi:hypothetical protein